MVGLFAPKIDPASSVRTSNKDSLKRALIASLLKTTYKNNPRTGLEAAGRIAQKALGAYLAMKGDKDSEQKIAEQREAFSRAIGWGDSGVRDPNNPWKDTVLATFPLDKQQLRHSQEEDIEAGGGITGGEDPERRDHNRIIGRTKNWKYPPGSVEAFKYGFKVEGKNNPAVMAAGANFSLAQLQFKQKEKLKRIGVEGTEAKQRIKHKYRKLRAAHKFDLDKGLIEFKHGWNVKLEAKKLTGKKSLQKLMAGFNIGRDNNRIVRKAFAEVGIRNAQMFMTRRLDAAKSGDRRQLAKDNAIFKMVLERLAAKVVTPGAKRMVAGMKSMDVGRLGSLFDNLLGENSSLAFGNIDSYRSSASATGLENFITRIGGSAGDFLRQGPSGPIPAGLPSVSSKPGQKDSTFTPAVPPQVSHLVKEGAEVGLPEFGTDPFPVVPGSTTTYGYDGSGEGFGAESRVENTNRDAVLAANLKRLDKAIDRVGLAVGKSITRFSGMSDKADIRNSLIRTQMISVERLHLMGFKSGKGVFPEIRLGIGNFVKNLLGIDLEVKGNNGDVKTNFGKAMENAKQTLREWGVPTGSQIGEAAALSALQAAMALSLRKPSDESGGLTGHTSDRDVRFLLQQTIGITNTIEGNRLLSRVLMKFNERTIAWGVEAKAWESKFAYRPMAQNDFKRHMKAWSEGKEGSVEGAVIMRDADDKEMINRDTRGLMINYTGGAFTKPIFDKAKEIAEITALRDKMKRGGYRNVWTGLEVPVVVESTVPPVNQFNKETGTFKAVEQKGLARDDNP